MELHQLRYFLAVADEGNFTRASARCHVSQPSLSSQIIKLEEELGQKLFNRLGRRIELTRAGLSLERRARAVFFELENAQREIREGAADVSGELRVGATPSVAPYLAPPVMAACARKHPKLAIRLEENLRRRLLEDLLDGNLEIALASYAKPETHVAAEPILRESLFLVTRTDHPLAGKQRLSIRDFKDEPLVILGESSTLGDRIFEFFGRNEFEPRIGSLCSQVKTVKALVSHGRGISILPAMARKDSEDLGLAYSSLASARMGRLIFALTHEKRYFSPGARAFIEELRAYVDTELDLE